MGNLADRRSVPEQTFDTSMAVDSNGSWLDAEMFRATLVRSGNTLGYLLFKAPFPIAPAERDDLALTLTAVCRPVTTGLEMLDLRNN